MGPGGIRPTPGRRSAWQATLSRPGAHEILLTPSAEAALKKLEDDPGKTSGSIARRVRNLKDVLLSDALHGEVVRKGAIPPTLVAKYGIENLFVEDLPAFWRLLYAITRDGPNRYVVILEIVDHRQYDRWFPGRGR